MSTMTESMTEIASELIKLLEEQKESNTLSVARLLYVRLRNPQAYVTITGETSTGKSSLVNGLIQRQLLPVAARPTTATVTHVICREEPGDKFFAIYRDATQEQISGDQFLSLSISPGTDLLRLQVRTKPVNERFIGLQIFDTPGYNAVLAEHEEVLRAFLPQSDVIIFVVGYRTGFGQVDQDLLEVISSSISHTDEIPVIMVVNRAPQGVTKNNDRIVEILSNARDCLNHEPFLIIINSVNVDTNYSQSRSPVIPLSLPLWDVVANEISKPAKLVSVQKRLLQLLRELAIEFMKRIERQEILLSAQTDDLREIDEQILELVSARDRSLTAVQRMVDRLTTQLPKTVERLAVGLKEKMAKEIGISDKWMGAHECAEWITGHSMPFSVRESAFTVEELISQELEMLNRELMEIANTAVKKISSSVHVKSDAAIRFAANLAGIVGKRIAGSSFQNVLRGLGGVGGAAAGAGNLVKMAVSRIGRTVGKTFSREVYTGIGKAFTKRALQRLNVVLNVVVEAAIILYDAKTWQNKLTKKVKEAIDSWASDVTKDLCESQIPAILCVNESDVHLFYDDLISGKSMHKDKDGADMGKAFDHLLNINRELQFLLNRLEILDA